MFTELRIITFWMIALWIIAAGFPIGVAVGQDTVSVSGSPSPESIEPVAETIAPTNQTPADPDQDAAMSPDPPPSNPTSPQAKQTGSAADGAKARRERMKQPIVNTVTVPWDYDPYRVLVWVGFDDSRLSVDKIESDLRTFLDRDFAAIWRMQVDDAPASVRALMARSMNGIDYDAITSSDPVLAIKRDHKDAVRIRTPNNVGEFVTEVFGAESEIATLRQRGEDSGDKTLDGVSRRLQPLEDPSQPINELWAKEETQGVLVKRGVAQSFTEPAAKLISPNIDGLISESLESYDKVFLVYVRTLGEAPKLETIELDVLMRFVGPVSSMPVSNDREIAEQIGRGLRESFAPMVRIENAGQTSAQGLVRASGLLIDQDSPLHIRVGDVLKPMTRKNDRNGVPILIGPIDWAYLHVTEPEVAVISADPSTGLQVGDQIETIAGKNIVYPQRVPQMLASQPEEESLEAELLRGEETIEVNLPTEKPNSVPVRLQYLGFTAGVRAGKVSVKTVTMEGPADGILEVPDVLVSINGINLESTLQLGRLVASTSADEPIKLKIVRGESEREVEIVPSNLSVRERSGTGRRLHMDYYSGRGGGLQGRKNARTFRRAIRLRPNREMSTLRLHAQGKPDFPLIGYEIYERVLKAKTMNFVGRTDWDGRLDVDRTEGDLLRLLYVKNGGAVLARLPLVPGLQPVEVADLRGDDLRLQAEAYIRGVQNSIIDLVAVRELFKARIVSRLRRGEMKKAKDLMDNLRNQPNNEALANDMGTRQTFYLDLLGNKNANQRRKVDQMFKTTRELLSKHINPKLIRDLESNIIEAEKNGGKLPPPKEDPDAVDPSASSGSAPPPKKPE